ncbi:MULTISPECIES: dipeptidase [Streptomycetaceae]|uniref:Peptidase n=1 Tax=Streptantibioticus cattleyicolor (strain ATCC 35852 / DSM 46488 / JCM 4925 / NBRC 14057 / NRRL 8057) TaxID=1003195 RepID=F8K4P9_STREN|nr:MULTISPECIES: dipeptidase [Streptomycetaceae]AEW96404.1 peptidase [Streptantibioticus cattleyicolor NRRL 8057 = DSM 46488]MYS60916.1 dipeptidase [Streptomyces sp. SID5468]CCB76744.1 Peptidase [Streptantibioticus cattleyicolor NRRL 8057 = DSM 46488]
MSTEPDAVVRAYIDAHRAAFLDDLAEWLRIPSVSADPERAGDVARSAEWLAAELSATGFPVAEVWPTEGLPAVYAEWPSADPGAPTVLVYGHHDVQPAARADGWDTEPFEPVVRDGRMYGRGAADDKGQVFFHTLGVRAHLAATGRDTPAVNLKLLIEGEEESGSPHFAALLRERADRLACDAVIVSDTGMWDERTPTVCTGMRGLTDCQIDLYGPDQDIHSGSFGGAVPNPATEAARLAAALHDEDRRVTVPGFYDGVIELTDRERALFAELPFDEAAWLRAAKSHALLGEAGYRTLERVWARPTAEVNGVVGGYTGPGGKTIVPSSAQLKLSFRLVAGQDPAAVERAVRAWVAGRLPDGIRHEITFWGATRPCLTPLDHPALQSVVRSMGRAFQSKILFTREGGSGPAADLQDVLEVPVLFLGISVPSDGWHSVNEKVELDLLLKGVETAAYLWGDLGEHWHR